MPAFDQDPMAVDDSFDSESLPAEPLYPEIDDGSRRATVFEIPDEHDVQPFTSKAETLRAELTDFEFERRAQKLKTEEPWAPFQSVGEWEMAEWAMRSGVSQGELDKFLQLREVCLWVTHLHALTSFQDPEVEFFLWQQARILREDRRLTSRS
jgi:hypothetical protein